MRPTIKDVIVISIIGIIGTIMACVLFAPNEDHVDDLVKKTAIMQAEAQIMTTSKLIVDPTPPVIINDEYLQSMKLHDEVIVVSKNGNLLITRVPGGWIYSRNDDIFIPERK